MFRRVLLAFTFVAALGAAGLGMSSKAMAWHRCYDDGYAYSTYYPSYYTAYDYAPSVSYYRSYPAFYGRVYDGYGHRHHHHHDRHNGGVRISFGF